MPIKFLNSLESAGFKRLLLAGADFTGDPVTGGKFVSLAEDGDSTTVVVKNGMNSVAERQPNSQPYWLVNAGSLVDWDENQNIEVAIEVVTPTASGDDVMAWAGIVSDTSQANWSNRAFFYGFRHSVVFSTDPLAGAWGGGAYVYSSSASDGRHLYSFYNSPKGSIKQSMNGGLRAADWDQSIADVRSGSIVLPASPSDTPYFAFTLGSMRNVALGSGSNVTFDFRLWYRVLSYEPV